MELRTSAYNRYFQPSLPQIIGLSVLSNVVVSGITYPLQFMKTCIQFRSNGVGFRGHRSWTMGYNPFKVLREASATGHGNRMLFLGLDAHLYARTLHLCARNTVYQALFKWSDVKKGNNDILPHVKALYMSIAGCVGAFVSNPLTVVSVRQNNDWQLKPEWRRNYQCTTTALRNVCTSGEWSHGLKANLLKAISLNSSLTVSYNTCKDMFRQRIGQWPFIPYVSLLWAVFIGTTVSLPFDCIRTKQMQLQRDPQRNRMNIKNNDILGSMLKTYAFEGSKFSMWAGFYTAFVYNYLFFGLVMVITQAYNDSWKNKMGLLEYEM